MSQLPEGYVDPQDQPRVAAIVAATLGSSGAEGVLALLARIPCVRHDAGTPRGFLRAAVPASAWLGPEDRLSHEGGVLVHQQVVGGVVLHRRALSAAELPAVVARLLAAVVAATGTTNDASAALTAHQEIYGPF